MRKIYPLLILLIPISNTSAAEEHCLVVQALAVAGYEARMQLLQGTDDTFDLAYATLQQSSDKVRERYNALIAARNKRGGTENPENHGASFGSPSERKEYFDSWRIDIKALEAAESSEMNSYTEAFQHAMESANAVTRRRLARIDALWKKEVNAPCYWGEPR